MDEQILTRDAEEELHRWRRQCFRELGFARPDAAYLDDAGVDLYEMADLLKAGCPSELAERILA
jgi:hypothetical protein